MKILLISPPRLHMLESPATSSYDEIEGFYPPLGLMYLASYIRENTRHEIEILDAQVEKMNYADIEVEIKEIAPQVVGIQTTSFTITDALLTAKVVKKLDKTIHICFGGPHASIYPNETILLPEVDSIVLDEGEITFAELVDCLDKGTPLEDVKGLVFKDGARVINTGQREPLMNLDLLPLPARDLLPIKKYYSPVDKSSFLTTMVSSRGCPYNCLFCYNNRRRYRSRSAQDVVDEMESCVRAGINEIYIFDDTFIIDRNRVLDIINGIIELGLELRWSFRGRVDHIDRELVGKLKKSGCNRINFGVEAGSQKILKIMRKGITLEQVREAFAITKEAGIATIAYFMIGFAGETRDHILKTIEFAQSLDPNFVVYSITTPFPATDLYELGLKKGVFERDYWKEFALNPMKHFIPEVWEENLSREEMVKLLHFGYRKFYTRPAYLIKMFAKVKSFNEFKRNVVAGLKLLKG